MKKEYREIYNTYFAPVLNRIYSRTGKMEDAEDICQEVFVRFYNNFETIKEESRWAWLKQAVRFEITNYYSKKQNREPGSPIHEADLEAHEISDRSGDLDVSILLKDALENPLNFEADTDRLLFELIALYGYTYAEASHELGITVRQVKYRYGIICRRLMIYLRARGITPEGGPE